MAKYVAATANGNVDGCTFVGRWVSKKIHGDSVMYTTNLGAEVLFQVSQTDHFTIEMLDLSHNDSPAGMIAVSLNEAAYQRFSLADLPITFKALDAQKSYQVRVVMSGNTDMDEVWSGQQGFGFQGVTVAAGGRITPIQHNGRQITFIGDSITAGCWVAGNMPSEDYRAEANYAAVAADLLGATNIRIAYSAAGLTRGGTGGVPNALTFTEQLDAETAFTAIQTNVVVVNLGTNDRTVSNDTFDAVMTQFLNQIQEMYPNSHLIVMVPFSQSFAECFHRIVAKFQGIELIETQGWPITYTDQTHPDLHGSQIAGQKLATELKRILGPHYF